MRVELLQRIIDVLRGKELATPFWKRNINTPDYLSIVAILKNEALYIKEWIEYHKLVGVERFYLYDNESEDNLKEILKSYIDDGIVIYKYFPGKCMQYSAYKDAIRRYKYKTKWLAIIDADEFIIPISKATLNECLKDFEDYPALCVNWVVYDSNGHIERPQGLVIENYTRTYKDSNIWNNTHIKSIVNPRKVNNCPHPHFCEYVNNQKAVNENFIPIDGPFAENNSVNKIRINHYFSKSKNEFIAKRNRGQADNNFFITPQEEDYNFPETKQDFIMKKYVTQLKAVGIG
jgi:hypothetical protein